MNWLKQWFAARKQRQLARFVTGFCFLMALAIPQAQAQQPCGDNKQQPTAAEQAYAARIRGIILDRGISADVYFACPDSETEKRPVMFVGFSFMSEALARNLARSIGLGTARASGYAAVLFSDEGVSGAAELWEYDIVNRVVRHGIQGVKGFGGCPATGVCVHWE